MTMPDTRSGGRENVAVGGEQASPGSEGSGAGTGSGAREQVRQAKEKVVDQARSTFRDARDRAGSTLNQSRIQAADQIGGIGGAFRRTSEQLRGEDQARFADMADSVARQIDRVADYLRDADGRKMTRDLESLARRQPALVFAGAFALGVVAARFLKSSAPDAEEGEGYERIYPGGEPAGLGSGFEREGGYQRGVFDREAGYGREAGFDRETGFDRESGGFDARS
jgi:hypothetical protein